MFPKSVQYSMYLYSLFRVEAFQIFTDKTAFAPPLSQAVLDISNNLVDDLEGVQKLTNLHVGAFASCAVGYAIGYVCLCASAVLSG